VPPDRRRTPDPDRFGGDATDDAHTEHGRVDRTERVRRDWPLDLAADTAARAESLAAMLAVEALEHPDDPELVAWCGLADRIARDLHRLIVELDTVTIILTRSRVRVA
jgi:hypothetical protein